MRIQTSALRICGWIPPGVFWGTNDYTPKRIAAMHRVQHLGSLLAAEHPEIADLYCDVERALTCLEIARRFIPQDEITRSPDVAAKAVVFALGLLLPEDERRAITHERRRRHIRARWDFTSEEFRNHCRIASCIRHEKHGVNVGAMLRGRGRIGWTQEEKRLLAELVSSGAFQNASGNADYGRIAQHLNTLFHEGRWVRYTNSCRSMMADARRKKRRDK